MKWLTVLIFTDGRDLLLQRTVKSLDDAWEPMPESFLKVIMIDDSADRLYEEWLELQYGDVPFMEIVHHEQRRGFCGAIQSAWSRVDTPWVFHVEDDFLFNEPVELTSMIEVLYDNPHLAQMALKRQPWSPEEQRAGDLVNMWPDAYVEHTDGAHYWIEHDLFFTTNPSVYSRELCEWGWPDGPQCESKFARQMVENGKRFAYWGRKSDTPKVTHIGDDRAGEGY